VYFVADALIILIFISLFPLLARRSARLLVAGSHWRNAFSHGATYWYQYILLGKGNSKKVTFAYVGIKSSALPDFALTRETGLFRFFKSLRLIREYQTGDTAFDEIIYVRSDDARISKWLSVDESSRDFVVDLLQSDPVPDTKFLGLYHSNGMLYVTAKVNKAADNSEAHSVIAGHCLGALERIDRELDHLAHRSNHSPQSDWRNKGELIVYIIAFALTCTCIISSWLPVHSVFNICDSPSLDAWTRYLVVAVVGMLICALIAIRWPLLAGNKLVFLIPLVSLIGFSGAARSLIENLNEDFDSSQSVGHAIEVRLKSKVTKTSSGEYFSRTHFYLWVSDWEKRQRTRKIEVPERTYYRAFNGGIGTVFERLGYLNIPWIENMEVSADPCALRPECRDEQAEVTKQRVFWRESMPGVAGHVYPGMVVEQIKKEIPFLIYENDSPCLLNLSVNRAGKVTVLHHMSGSDSDVDRGIIDAIQTMPHVHELLPSLPDPYSFIWIVNDGCDKRS